MTIKKLGSVADLNTASAKQMKEKAICQIEQARVLVETMQFFNVI